MCTMQAAMSVLGVWRRGASRVHRHACGVHSSRQYSQAPGPNDITKLFNPEIMKGKVVFVTGGGSGINLGIAKSFARVGASVAICGRNTEKLEAAAQEIAAIAASTGAKVFACPADVRDYQALADAFALTKTAFGAPIHTLVAGAAGNFVCSADKLTPNGFKTVVDIDLLGSFHAAHAAFPHLKETQGNIIFITAGQGIQPYSHQAHVGAAKAGVENLMKNLALEWGPHQIRSNSIVPGPIDDTEGMRRLAPGDDKHRQQMMKAVPIGRFGSVDEIGQAAVFLASPLASYVTGATFMVDGGMSLPGSGLFSVIMSKMVAAQQK